METAEDINTSAFKSDAAPQTAEQPEKKRKNSLWNRIKRYLHYLVDISVDTDIQSTIDNITKGVVFRGMNVWILVFAILVASVGLNVNSTAVIIGAMLISPLMGPIMGVGLSISISDNGLLRKSLKNLLVMVVVSLLASTTYFLLSPLSDAQSELLARTKPTIYDVFIAFFGGLAGIVASSRKQERVNIVAGVAIATALMPPLCTAGYGLGTGQFKYFIGAFYLFFINSFFIALATFVMTRYMKFPRRTYVNPQKERQVHRSIILFAIIVILPSLFMAIEMVRETSFTSNTIQYVTAIEKSSMFNDVQIISAKRNYARGNKTLTLTLIGKELSQDQIELLQQRLAEFDLADTKLTVKQAGGSVDIETQETMLQRFIEHKEWQVAHQDSIINQLHMELDAERGRGLNVTQLAREAVTLFPDIKAITAGDATQVNAQTFQTDSIPLIDVMWQGKKLTVDTALLNRWLCVRLQVPKIHVNNHIEAKTTHKKQR